MQLTVLGKYGPYPPAGGGTSSYLVREKDDAVVLDFGSGALGRLQQHMPLDALRTVILSHLHYDHICDLLPLSYALQVSGKTVDVILPDTDCPQRSLLQSLDGLILVPMLPVMQIGEFAVQTQRMQHPLPSYAVKLTAAGRTLFYGGDTTFCPQLPAFAKDSHVLLLDCAKPEDGAAPHMSLSEAAFLAQSLSVPAIASHLHPKLRYVAPSPLVTIAEEGKTYTV